MRSGSRSTIPSRWDRRVAGALAVLAVSIQSIPSCSGLEVLDAVVDRDGDVLVVEDILEGFGRVPVSVAFSPTSSHMFIGFKSGEVRIYPEGGDTLLAAVYDSCVDIEETVRWMSPRALCAAELMRCFGKFVRTHLCKHISWSGLAVWLVCTKQTQQ